MKQGEIVIINFPFTSLENSKIRPALVISNKHFNRGANIVLLAISTQKGPRFYSEKLTQDCLQEGKLLKNSFVRFSNILSLEKNLIIRKIGKLKKKRTACIGKKIIQYFSAE